jgi:hypothetical protein
MKELLETLLKENQEMMMEISGVSADTSYQTGYLQALLNVKSSLEFQLKKLQKD